jgi:hypothetical protein
MSNELNLDLDINNYSMNDFNNFFNLTEYDKIQDIKQKIDETTNKLLFSDNAKYNNNTKKEIISFLNKAKDIIISRKDSKTTKMVSGSPHFVQAINSLPDNYVNQAEFNYKTRLVVFNSLFNDLGFAGDNTNTYTFTFPEHIKNVIGINLSALQYPNVELAFSKIKGNNLLFIQENYTNDFNITTQVDGNSATIELPDGTYSITDFPAVLQKQINVALGYPTTGIDGDSTSIFTLPRYYVSINPNSYRTTISNNLNPNTTQYPLALAYSKSLNNNNDFFANFTIVFDKPTWTSNASNVCVPGIGENKKNYLEDTLPYSSLGNQMGYRNIIVTGASTYTSISIYNSNIVNYVYFSLEDYIPNRIDNVSGLLLNEVFDRNILALVPITSAPFTSNLDSGANFIFKTRNYTGPVNIQKITVAFFNFNGALTELNGIPFSFAIEFKIAYENPASKATVKNLGVGFDETAI